MRLRVLPSQYLARDAGRRGMLAEAPVGEGDGVHGPDTVPRLRRLGEGLVGEGEGLGRLAVGDGEERLRARGVEFKSPPVQVGDAKMAVFSDTCGNWVALTQESTG